jgi:hypothetical protein
MALFLLVTLISTHFSMYVVYAGFTMNQKFIAEKLCINKSRPWLHCNGKCYFMKKIRQAEENEKKQESKDHLNRLEISFLQEPFRFSVDESGTVSATKDTYPIYVYHYSSRYLDCIFRPPKQVA